MKIHLLDNSWRNLWRRLESNKSVNKWSEKTDKTSEKVFRLREQRETVGTIVRTLALRYPMPERRPIIAIHVPFVDQQNDRHIYHLRRLPVPDWTKWDPTHSQGKRPGGQSQAQAWVELRAQEITSNNNTNAVYCDDRPEPEANHNIS